MAASRPVRRRLTISVSRFLVLDQGLTFRLQRHSLHQISSIVILAAAEIPVQMEFLVGTGRQARLRPDHWAGSRRRITSDRSSFGRQDPQHLRHAQSLGRLECRGLFFRAVDYGARHVVDLICPRAAAMTGFLAMPQQAARWLRWIIRRLHENAVEEMLLSCSFRQN